MERSRLAEIEVVDADDPRDIRLKVMKDPGCDLMGWYNFRASGVRGVACRFSLINAGESLKVRLANREDYEDRWTNTGPVASYDRETWFRLPATFDGMVFRLSTLRITTFAITRRSRRSRSSATSR